MEGAEAVQAAIRDAGGVALLLRADISRPDEIDAAFGELEGEFGPIGLLVNNAALHRGGRIQRLELADWQQVLDVGLTGAFVCCRRVVPGMIQRGTGRIVNVSSVVGLNGFPGDAAYSAAKAGLLGLTKALALELARDGITVNAVVPGFVDTEMTRSLDQRVLERAVRSVPLGRMASVAEVADAVEYLVVGPAYSTGSNLVLDGGWTLA
jgi:3-oxoacyl-[acyl-carrier protein] reductase